MPSAIRWKRCHQEVKALGGEVMGSVRHPLNTPTSPPILLQAQGSGAQVIGLANAGTDTTTRSSRRPSSASPQAGQSLAGLLLFISDVHALGLRRRRGWC